jgi:hypothetical protein
MSNFLTVSGLKAFRPSGSTAALDFTGWTDDQLQTILDEVEEIFESGTGNKFHSFSETVYVSGVHQAFLFLRRQLSPLRVNCRTKANQNIPD